ncbi:MAG: hypothetical protein OEQ53_14195 [Saprospiraceae bacterium]|nr:hypothetical protein [Saprospiraceae bacterium]
MALSQADSSLIWLPKNVSLADLEKEFDLTRPDTVEFHTWLRGLISQMHDAAYLEASIDSLSVDADGQYLIYLHRGPAYSWAHLDFSKVPEGYLDVIRPYFTQASLFSYSEIRDIFEKLLIKAENSGFPFATVRLDNVMVQDSKINARVDLELRNQITMESFRMEGDLQITRRYLEHFLDVRAGDPFSRQKIVATRTRLEELPFVKSFRIPTVSFLGDGATLNLYLNRKPANQFDILLGLIPSNNENQRFRLTGNVNIAMENQFGAGERFHMNFESLQPATQQLELDFIYPFIFSQPFGADLHFDLYKRDSTYIDLNYELGIRYFVGRRSSIKFFLDNSRSNLLRIDSTVVKTSRQLPAVLDLTRSLFGIEYQHTKLDYLFNPRRGRQINISGSAGRKRIRKSDLVTELVDDSDPGFDFNDLYNALDLNQFQLRVTGMVSFYLPLFQSSTLKIAQNTGWIRSDEGLYENELFRIGGAKIFRGFNEESILANFYSLLTIEYRLLFSQNSNLFIFSDLGYYQQRSQIQRRSDNPIGVGIGMNIETKIGVFGISYAIGKQEGDPFNFRTGKIHFGMVSIF